MKRCSENMKMPPSKTATDANGLVTADTAKPVNDAMISCNLKSNMKIPTTEKIGGFKNHIDSAMPNSFPTVNGTSSKVTMTPNTTEPGSKKPPTDVKAMMKHGSIELLNFGTAPLEVIEKFQEFCFNHQTLSDAIRAILTRGDMLKKKYRFKQSAVTYQMLVGPTPGDTAVDLQSAIAGLQRFTRMGKYESIANAIEELLFSPEEADSCSKGTWTCGDVSTSYTELSRVEQLTLEKIADALLNRLSAACPPQKRRYTRRVPDAKNRKISTEKKTAQSSSKSSSPNSSFENKGKAVEPPTPKTQGSYLSLKSSSAKPHMHKPLTVVDQEVAVPLKNFLKINSTKFKHVTKPDISPYTRNKKSPSKSQFYKLFLDLMPERLQNSTAKD